MIKICAVTDIGLSRQENQDGFFIDGLSAYNTNHKEIYLETDNKNMTIFVADGVGGTQDGKYAVEKIINLFKTENVESLDAFLNFSNSRICDDALLEGKQTATTIAGIVISDKTTSFNVGDSKVFVINNGYLDQKSTDDTMETLVRESGLDYGYLDAMGKTPLTQCIGNKKEIINVHMSEIDLQNDIIICTDGLTDSLNLDEIEEIICQNTDIRIKVKKILEAAYENGCRDNITLIYICFNGD